MPPRAFLFPPILVDLLAGLHARPELLGFLPGPSHRPDPAQFQTPSGCSARESPWRWWRSRGCPLPRWPLRTPGWEFLDGCLAPAQGQSFCGPFAIVSRAWPAPTETSIVVGRSGPRPRCQGGHARWWPPLTQDGAGAQGAAFCPRFVTITGTTFSWVQARTNPKQPFVSTSIFISSNPRRSARRIECPL